MAIPAGSTGRAERPRPSTRAAELVAAGRPFAFATVVAVRRPTSARPGAHGIVHPDGSIEGWVGGRCAQPVVVREALRSLADGQPRLLRLSKDAPAEGRRGDGVVELVMTCHSGGTLEIYVEPHPPRAGAVGRRHDADRRGPASRWEPPRASASRSSTRSPMPPSSLPRPRSSRRPATAR